MAVKDWSTTPASNTTVGGKSIAENMAPGDVNDAMRAIMADAKARFNEIPSGTDIGALGDGIANDAVAIQAALDAGFKTITLGYGNYRFATKITLPANAALVSSQKAVITKGANIDLFDMSAQGCRLQGLNIQGAGATYTGRGAYINAGASSYDQKIVDCDMLDMNGYCLEFVGSDAGQRFEATNSNFCRTTVTNPAIKMPGALAEDIVAGNRTFTDCGTISGGQLFDLDGAANSGVVNSLMVSILTGAKTSRSRFVANRVAIGGGTQVLDGYDNIFLGDVVAGNLQLAPTSQRCVVGPNSLIAGGTITDLSTATGSNMNYIYDAQGFSFTPVLGQTAGTGPTLGNGTATGRKYQNGRLVTVMVDVQFGSTSTFGDAGGDITVAMPAPHNRTAVFPAQAMAIATIGGVNAVGAVQIAQGDNKFTIVNNGGTTGWKQGQPGTFTATSRIRFTITYEQG